MKRLTDLKLVDGIKRPLFGDDIEKSIVDCKAADEGVFAHRLLNLDEQPDGSVVITAPGGLTVHVYAHAILSKKE